MTAILKKYVHDGSVYSPIARRLMKMLVLNLTSNIIKQTTAKILKILTQEHTLIILKDSTMRCDKTMQ